MKPLIYKLCLLSFLLSVSLRLAYADDAAIKQQLLAQPPARLLELQKKLLSQSLSVEFLRADLDGSGKFQFLIALYSLDGNGVFLRVFKQEGSQLTLVGEQEDKKAHGSWGTHASLVDINGDGIPEVDLAGTAASGQQTFEEYLVWTGTSLHSAISYVPDARLEDIDSDGVLELISANGDGTFNIYKFQGTNFVLSQTVNHDPQGIVGSDGKAHFVRSFLNALHPHAFSLADIRVANRSDKDRDDEDREKGKVKVVMGKLKDLDGKIIPVEDVDTNTLVLDHNLRPIRVSVRPTEKDDDHDFKTVLELEFARLDILHLLPKLKLTAPLAVGDKLKLFTHGKLKDGRPVSAVDSAVIRGDKDGDDDDNDKDKEHHSDHQHTKK